MEGKWGGSWCCFGGVSAFAAMLVHVLPRNSFMHLVYNL